MTIVLVEDMYLGTDGTARSTQRFRDELIKLGHTVRIVSIGVEGADMYGLKEHRVPIVSAIAAKNNMFFGKFNRELVGKAFEGADVVHLSFPWQVHQKCLALAKKMDIPVSAAFHVQPENFIYNIKFKLLGFINHILYYLFKLWLYRKVDNIHCPSRFAAGELLKHNYNARLHVISNGISDDFIPLKTESQGEDCASNQEIIHVLMTGRLAEEKRQDIIIKAVNHSKYREKIQIHFAGRGPMQKRYQRQGAKLPLPPVFVYLPQKELRELIYKTDIYIHASEVETEGISVLEAISCGKVPIICNSKGSASSQFALDERSLFAKGNYLELRDKLDYWIEHPQERRKMEKEYAHLGEKYNIKYSAKKLEEMFKHVIRDHKTARLIRTDPKIKKYNRKVERNNFIKEFFCKVFYFIIAFPLLAVFNKCWFGLKIKNRSILKKLKNTGAVAICNHIHEMDSPICAVALRWRKLSFVSIPENFHMPVAGFFVNILGSVPAPSSPKELQVFIYSMSKKLRKKQTVLFFPEAHRQNYNENLRNFQRGAFYLAVDAKVPVLPIKILLRPPDGLWKLIKKKPCFTLVLGEPLYSNDLLPKKQAIDELKERAEKTMKDLSAE